MSSALHADWSALPPQRRNLNRLLFLPDPTAPPRSTVGTTPEERAATAAQIVAGLRVAAARHPDDPDLATLLHDLRAGSAEFATLWETEQASAWRSHTKTVNHPTLVPLVLDCDTLHVPDTDRP